MGGVAILPILAGAGVEGYRRPFGESINAQAASLYGAEHVVRWDAAMTAINGAGLSGQYGDAISIYRETSILPSDILLEIGRAVKSRYLLVVTLNPPTSNSRQPHNLNRCIFCIGCRAAIGEPPIAQLCRVPERSADIVA